MMKLVEFSDLDKKRENSKIIPSASFLLPLIEFYLFIIYYFFIAQNLESVLHVHRRFKEIGVSVKTLAIIVASVVIGLGLTLYDVATSHIIMDLC